jgi:perosamine synthetase
MGIIKLPKESINFFKSNLDEIFESGNLAEGKWNSELSDFVKKYCNVSHAIPTCSNGSGIVALLNIYREYYGKKDVLIQSNTMYGVKTMVYSADCNLAGYIDCELVTLMPSVQQVKEALDKYSGQKDKLIILLSHIGGIINPDIQKITVLCKQNSVILLEDCAHSFGATLNGLHSGTFGNAGVFSFYSTKSIPAGEGGIVITNDSQIGTCISKYVIYDRFDQKQNLGVNIRPSEIQALLIYSAVNQVNEIIDNKKQIAKDYEKTCTELLIPFINQSNGFLRGNYYKFVVYHPELPISSFLSQLKTKTSGVYDYVLGNSHEIATHHACLPIWYGQDKMITEKAISELYKSLGK